MSYSITRYNGTALGTILDGTIDNTKTSLTLIGRNYSNYGQIMVNNLVNLVENFSRSYEPSNPISGQLWWDSGNNLLKIYTGTLFKVVGSCTSQPTAPSTTVVGDLWWDTANQQLNIYNGSSWTLIGPVYKTGHKSGVVAEEITDGTATHYVTSIYVDEVRTAIVSKDAAFVPNVGVTGFTVVNPGYNANSSISSYKFWGLANNSSYLGGLTNTSFLRTDSDNLATGNLRIQIDQGLAIGASLDLELSVNVADAVIKNVTSGGNIGIYANVSGLSTKFISIDATSGVVEVAASPSTALGVATKGYVDGKFNNTVLTGIPTSVTAPAGTSNTMIATTAFVNGGLSGLFSNKIYQGNSIMEILDSGSGTANLALDNVSVLTASVTGVNLFGTPTAPTQAQTYTSVGNDQLATTQYVRTAGQWWGGSAKFVSSSAPTVGDGNNGDIWFQLSS
jgi:hypothetical protein